MSGPRVTLDHFGVTDLEIHLREQRMERTLTNNVTIGYDLTKLGEAHYRVGMLVEDHVRAPDGAELHWIKVHVFGFFTIGTEAPPTEEAGREVVTRHGLTLLYGALRGILLTAGGCFPTGFRYVLPTVNMAEVVREIQEKAFAPESGISRGP